MLEAQVYGFLGSDAKKITIKDTDYLQFSIAHPQGENDTLWVNILKRDSGKLLESLKKGTSVLCYGSLNVGTYATEQGVRATVTLWCNKLQFVGRRLEEGKTAERPKPIKNLSELPTNESGEDDLPF